MHVDRRHVLGSLAGACLSLSSVTRSLRRGLLTTRPEASAFLEAVRAGDLPRVRDLLAVDAGLASATDAEGRSAFVLAHLGGHVEVARALRETGLVLDRVEAVLAQDWDLVEERAKADPAGFDALHPVGGTPLYAAALVGSGRLWQLRSLGCDPDAAPAGGSGWTPARGALEAREPEWALRTATELLANGADVNARQRGGDSILHGAVRRRDARLVRMAVRKGSDPDARDDGGRTARELATALGWEEGARLLARPERLPRDHRASRFARDANGEPVRWVQLTDVPRAVQSRVTGSSHNQLDRVRELVDADPRLVFSFSTDDELAIEASAHMGNRPLIRYHLDHGAPLALPTAVALGDLEAVERMLLDDPLLVHERGAHDFPVLFFAVFGGGSVEMAELLLAHGVPVGQESAGTTALHWCMRRGARELAAWLIEAGADPEAVGYTSDRAGATPLDWARDAGRPELERLLREAGARR